MTTNGVTRNVEIGSLGLGGNGLVTYKRRRAVKVAEGGKTFDDSLSQSNEKSMKHSVDQAKCSEKDSHPMPVSSSDCSLKHQRNIILEQIYQSLDSEGGLVKCIQNALLFHPGSSSRTTVKESVHSCEDWNNCTFHAGTLHDDLHNAAKDSVEKFAELCSLLLQNFQGIKADKLFDFNHINSRMKERAYENSPLQFQSDIQQIWMKLQKVGNDITALAKCLSDKTMTSFCEQVGNSAHSISEDGKPEFLTQQSDVHPKAEPTEASALDEAHTCQRCKLKADGRNCLVCDSCEEMYHISCIEPPVKEIPTRSWYCAKCTAKGTESPHEYCTACERLNASRSPFDENEKDDFMYGKVAAELEESSNELVANEGGKRSQHCTACRTEVRNDEEYRMCGHSFCSHKFYHVKCLTNERLISHGLCCHLILPYPEGNGFAKNVTSTSKVYGELEGHMNLQNISRKRALDRKLKGEGSLDKSGGVDMLLNAKKTLSYEENQATMGLTT
ncbi:UNVERIFIED_CONTAM: Lysine-specific demethylase 5C [Sesamum angustifolium]|uniref:Lysine-specific demethylase 5C n=1 Tax=Sesamum angustifolium TaxID=2727405 RepID=A0AAW2LYR7_9LAMI